MSQEDQEPDLVGRGELRLLLALASVSVILLVALVWRWGVDVPVLDEWSLVDDLGKYYEGTWTLADMLRSHNGHRVLIHRLILVPLASLTGWNTRVEMALTIVFAAGTVAVLSVLFGRVVGSGRALHACLALTCLGVFSLNQWENWLIGVQMHWSMAVFFVLAALAALSSWAGGAGAVAAVLLALLASFTHGAGLAVWPAGLVALLGRAETRAARVKVAGAWLAAAVLVVAIYSRRLPGDAGLGTPSDYAYRHPFAYAAYVLTFVGAPIVSYTGTSFPPSDIGVAACVGGAGLVLVGGATWTLHRHLPRTRPSCLPLLAVAVWSLAVAAQVGLGRADAGRSQAMSPRYIALSTPFWAAGIALLAALATAAPEYRTVVRALGATLGVAMVISSIWHISRFPKWWLDLQPAVAALRWSQPDDQLLRRLHPEIDQVSSRVRFLRRQRLSVFRPGRRVAAASRPLTDFRQGLEFRGTQLRFATSETRTLPVTVTNLSKVAWSAQGRDATYAARLSYRWLTQAGVALPQEGTRTALPGDLHPGETAELQALVTAPEVPGSYLLRFTMVQEEVAWFDAAGGRPLDLQVAVGPGPATSGNGGDSR